MTTGLTEKAPGEAKHGLKVLFQPVLDLDKSRVFGFEAQAEFEGVAGIHGSSSLVSMMASSELGAWEDEYHYQSLRAFSDQSPDKCLLLPISSASIVDQDVFFSRLLAWCQECVIAPEQVVLQLSLCAEADSQARVFEMLSKLVQSPFLSSLTCPMHSIPTQASEALLVGVDYIRLNRSVVHRLDTEPLLQDAIATLIELAAPRGTHIMAGSVENYLEFDTLRRLGVMLTQGEFIAGPQHFVAEDVNLNELVPERLVSKGRSDQTPLRDIASSACTLSPGQSVRVALEVSRHNVGTTPVVCGRQLVGGISEAELLRACVKSPSVIETKTVADFMQPIPLSMSIDATVGDLGERLKKQSYPQAEHGIALTQSNGDYAGMLSATDAIQALAEYQHEQTRYANPLTGLPGRVVLDEKVDELLQDGGLFVVVLVTINDLNAYNDGYGRKEGDRVIQQVASILYHESDGVQDYVAHINGGRFSIVFRSSDWFERCEKMVAVVDRVARSFYNVNDQLRGSASNVDRLGRRSFAPFFSLAIGAVPVFPGKFSNYQEVFASAAEVQQRASATYGGAIYVDQRKYRSATGHLTVRLS